MKARSALLFIAVLSAPLRAQDSGSIGDSTCLWARPLPSCRVVLLTNAGVYLNPAPAWRESQLRAIADWGLIVNSGRHDAVGASWFVMLDADEFSTGPVLRYRRWFSERRSLDLTVGTPVSTGGDLMVGSVLGMIKYNPEDWVGFALRPELVRRRSSTSGRVYAGAEVGSSPGLTLTIGGGIVLGLLAFLAAALEP